MRCLALPLSLSPLVIGCRGLALPPQATGRMSRCRRGPALALALPGSSCRREARTGGRRNSARLASPPVAGELCAIAPEAPHRRLHRAVGPSGLWVRCSQQAACCRSFFLQGCARGFWGRTRRSGGGAGRQTPEAQRRGGGGGGAGLGVGRPYAHARRGAACAQRTGHCYARASCRCE